MWAGQWQMTDQLIAIGGDVTCSVDEGREEIAIWLHFSNTIDAASVIHLENYITKWILVYKDNVYHTKETDTNHLRKEVKPMSLPQICYHWYKKKFCLTLLNVLFFILIFNETLWIFHVIHEYIY